MDVMQETTVRFDKHRFVEAVFEIIQRCADEPERLGKARLHAALYYSDMGSYLDRSVPITGAEYVKEPFGPGARYLDWALDLLTKEGRVSVERTMLYGMPRFTFKVLAPANDESNVLSDQDRAALRFWAEWVCGFNQTDFDDICRLEPWKSVSAYGDPIPYASAFLLLPERRPTKRDKEWADRKASKVA